MTFYRQTLFLMFRKSLARHTVLPVSFKSSSVEIIVSETHANTIFGYLNIFLMVNGLFNLSYRFCCMFYVSVILIF